MNAKQIADYLVSVLKENGFLVHRYDAVSTGSIYLKLDYGVASSIRISDHKGKRYLHYTFNVETWREECTVDLDKYGNIRYYYPSTKEALDKLINEAISRRDKRKERYGEKYQEYMKENQKQGLSKAAHTFWHKARLV